MLLEDGGVLGQQPLLLLLDDLALTTLLLRLELRLGHLSRALCFVNDELLLPQALDLALVFQLAHAALLSIHLLQALILRELLHQLSLELVLHALFLSSSLLLESHLELLSSLQLLSDAHTLLCLCTLLGQGCFFCLLNVKFIPEVFLEFCCCSALSLLCS